MSLCEGGAGTPEVAAIAGRRRQPSEGLPEACCVSQVPCRATFTTLYRSSLLQGGWIGAKHKGRRTQAAKILPVAFTAWTSFNSTRSATYVNVTQRVDMPRCGRLSRARLLCVSCSTCLQHIEGL
jgi:hypothetical protein